MLYNIISEPLLKMYYLLIHYITKLDNFQCFKAFALDLAGNIDKQKEDVWRPRLRFELIVS